MGNDFYSSIEYDLSHNASENSIMDHYKVEEEIYRSRSSYIFIVTDIRDNSKKILKAIRLIEGIEFDVELIKMIKHENMAQIYEHFYTDIFLYLVKEYIVGENLEELINKNGPLAEAVGLSYIKQLVEVLDYLHNYNDITIIYRDLKPSNIIVTPSGQLLLIDLITLREKKDNVSTDTFYIGSHGYAAPEQYGFLQSSEKADIYALGACLYFIMTGSHPVNEKEISQQLDSQKHISDKIKKVISKATSFSPDSRYDSISQIEEALTTGLKRVDLQFKIVSALCALCLVVLLVMIFQTKGNENNISGDQASQEQITIKNEGPTNEEASESGASEVVITDEVEEKETEPEVIEQKDTIFDPISPNDVVEEDIYKIEQGMIFNLGDDNVMNIQIDRDLLTDDIKDFLYISVQSSSNPYTEQDLKLLAFDAVDTGHGFEFYNYGGFGSVLENRTNLGIVIYDEFKYPIGYYYYNDIEINESPEIPDMGRMSIDDEIVIEFDPSQAVVEVVGNIYFTKIAVWGHIGYLDDDSIGTIRAEVDRGNGIHDYFEGGHYTGYGDTGNFLGQSWMVFLLDDDMNVIKEYQIQKSY